MYMQPKKPKYNKQLNEITYISFYVYMLSKSSKVTIENQVLEEVVWFGFGIQILEINISLTKCSLWTMKNAADLQLETKQEIR